MRRVRYQVATSLDGFIADSQDGYGWIPEEPDFDFQALFDQFDTLLMGRRTFEAVTDQMANFAGKQILVFSRQLDPAEHPDVRIVRSEAASVVAELKAREGSDIWLYGGGVLFRSLLQARLVDTVEPAVMPVLLGEGRRMLPSAAGPWTLRLERSRTYERSGMVLLEYRVDYGASDPALPPHVK